MAMADRKQKKSKMEKNDGIWDACALYAIGVSDGTQNVLKVGVTNDFDETIDEASALQNVLQNARHNLPDEWNAGLRTEYFAWNFGPGATINAKRDLLARLRLAGYQRSDIMNVQGSHTVDYFDLNGGNDENVMNIINDFLFHHKIDLNDYFLICPVCGDYTYNTDTYSCYNAQIEVGAEERCGDGNCITVIHEECMDEYLRTHPRVSRDIESEEWLCHCCL